ncbi:Cu(+)/Ag(+) sensor histidine kinase [Biostraticola tofi]|uniref:Sensor protein n=1 Tax=Biostraticola tofi TaxID=466109 RepID=A0A4V2W4T5_9GAMM|nr:Cu(+)/Ag(+) sensor histidine kinase [Biostraticola tofi]TCV96729.1 two-component system heavy metal sensor histidine kinase CusS [Biostraticola tofi]
MPVSRSHRSFPRGIRSFLLATRPLSLAMRLTCFISLATIAAFVAFAWIMLHSVEHHFAEQDVSDLKQISATLANTLKKANEPQAEKVEKLRTALAGYRNIAVLLKTEDNRLLYRSADGPDLDAIGSSPAFAANLASREVFTWSDTQSTQSAHGDSAKHPAYRVIASTVQTRVAGKVTRYSLMIALSIDFHLHYIEELKHNLIMIAAGISLLIVFIVLFAVYKGHTPLRNVSKKIKNITSENLDVRLDPHKVPIELEQLVISFNNMIERIEDVFTRQANFSADIAHEIRTPITNLITQTEIVLRQPRTIKELEDVLYSNLEEFSHMAKMVSDMLFLAQADNQQLIPERSLIDLETEVRKVFEFFEAWADEREVRLNITGRAQPIEGDPLMLRRAISNLLSNAVRYTPPGNTIIVQLTERDQWVEIQVENPGAMIAEQHLPRLFDRFYRADPSRQKKGEGSGIGLAIVKSIVTAHQGKISVSSDAVSTKFSLSLPKRAS